MSSMFDGEGGCLSAAFLQIKAPLTNKNWDEVELFWLYIQKWWNILQNILLVSSRFIV